MSEPVIKCDAVYKVFGVNAKKMLQGVSGNVDAKSFQEAGCIVGVNNASFEVSKGEMLVVMGLSGSGKSTLLRCISRLTDATAGKIYIEGQDLLALKNKELIELRRNKMGMVFQSFALLPHKTVLENIAFPLQIKGMKTEESISKAVEMVKLVGNIVEQSYVAIRNIRRDSLETFRTLEKNKEISQDESRKAQEELQKLTEYKSKSIDEIKVQKETDVMEI